MGGGAGRRLRGLRHWDGTVSFAPRLRGWLAFNLLIRGQRLGVEVNHASARYLLEDGGSLDVVHHGKRVKLAAGRRRSARSRRSRPPPGPASRRDGGNPAGSAATGLNASAAADADGYPLPAACFPVRRGAAEPYR